MTTATIEERVARGAALLDQKNPGWENEVDLKKFNIRRCDQCVLGQVYGGYYGGAQELGIYGAPGQKVEMAHGFWGAVDPNTGNDALVDQEYKKLQETWVAVIEERRAMRTLEAERPLVGARQ